jgi:hypothetical protein
MSIPPPQHENHEPLHLSSEPREQELDVAWGGLSLSVRGGIVVLVLMLMALAGLDLYSLNELHRHLNAQDHAAQNMEHQMDLLKERFSTEHRSIVDEVTRNRASIREVARVCLLTPDQRARVQQNMPSSIRELLLEGIKP